MEELRKRMSKGKIGIDEVKQAFVDATSEGGQFYNGMEEGSKTTEGLISTLQDNINSKLGEAVAGLSDKFKDVLPKLIEFVENIDVQEVMDKAKAAIEKVRDVLGQMYDKFVELSPAIAGVTAAVVAFKTAVAIVGLIQTVSAAITAFKAANEATTIAQAALNAVMNANPFVLVATLIAGVVAALVTLWNTNEDFRNKVIEVWNTIKDNAIALYEGLKQIFTEDIPQAFHELLEKVKGWGSDVVNKIREGISSAWEGLKSWFTGLWDGLFGNRNVNVNVNHSTNGSHASGLNYVPFDGYVARLHKGERVLTREESENYRSSNRGGVSVVQNIYSQAKTAADLMEEALYQQKREVLLGV